MNYESQGKWILVRVSEGSSYRESTVFCNFFKQYNSFIYLLLCMLSSAIHCNVWLITLLTGADPGIFYWGGGGEGPNLGSEKTVEFFCSKLLLTHTPPHPSYQLWLHVIIPCPLLCTWILLAKQSTLEHPPLVLGNKDCTDFTKCNVRFFENSQPVKKWYTILSM